LADNVSERQDMLARNFVAELGSAFLCADIGITPEIREDHAACLCHWLNLLKEDKRAIFSAAAHAQRAAAECRGLVRYASEQQVRLPPS
jgi:antirestriction protein ArdC